MAAKRAFVALPKLHTVCRSKTYCRDETQARVQIPDEKVPWSVNWDEYDPDDFTMPGILKGPVWADPNIRYVRLISPQSSHSNSV